MFGRKENTVADIREVKTGAPQPMKSSHEIREQRVAEAARLIAEARRDVAAKIKADKAAADTARVRHAEAVQARAAADAAKADIERKAKLAVEKEAAEKTAREAAESAHNASVAAGARLEQLIAEASKPVAAQGGK